MTPHQLANWLRQCYASRSNDEFERGLSLLDRATTHPDVRLAPGLSREHLQERRGELLSELAAVNDALAVCENARAGLHPPPPPAPGPSIEASE